MGIPVAIPAGPLAVTNAENTSAETLLAAFAQLLEYGTSGATTTTPPFLVPVSPNPVATAPVLLDTAEKQLMYRQLFLAITHYQLMKTEVSTTPGADLIPRALGTGKIDPEWLAHAAASVFGIVQLSSAPAGAATALNSEEVVTASAANKVPRADGSGHIAYQWLVQDIFGETPSGTVDGANKVFTTANAYRTGTLRVFLNGLRQKPTTHYSETTSNSFTFVSAPTGGSLIVVDYSR